MSSRLRVGAVCYLNTRPLIHGMDRGEAAERIELSFATPAALSEELAAGQLDIALLPVIELARIPDLELVPDLAITTHGPCLSVLLVSHGPPESIGSLALDPESCSSNALARVLLDRVWKVRPQAIEGAAGLEDSLLRADATVRIGDKALFEPLALGLHVHDLGEVWSRETGLPFVFAAWAARAGVVDPELCRLMHDCRRRGVAAVDEIAADYAWNGHHDPELARDYLTRHIRYGLGPEELEALERFFREAHRLELIDEVPEIRLALDPVPMRQP
jgi:chorismate dehydratase